MQKNNMKELDQVDLNEIILCLFNIPSHMYVHVNQVNYAKGEQTAMFAQFVFRDVVSINLLQSI